MGYRAVGIWLRAASPSTHHPSEIPSPPLLLPSTTHKDDLPEADMPLRKRACFTALASGFEVRESSAAAARQPRLDVATVDATLGHLMSREVGYGIGDVWDDMLTAALGHIQTLEAREPARTNDDTEDAGSSRVADTLAEIEANKTSRNGDDSHDSGTASRRTERAARECTYSVFLKCQPLNFKAPEGVTVGHDAAYGMPWKTLKKMMTAKYFPRGEIKKLEIELWNLKVKGTDGSVTASKPKTMQDAIEFATKLMDQKIRSLTDRQAENKRKFDDTSRNNQNQQQPFKRHNVARAYTAGPGEKKVYGGSKPLCPKCNYHHDGQCVLEYVSRFRKLYVRNT
ncbi:hypothetical protein Tco_0215575 [Tanacetum coccineum]